jgi:two-component system cell cycle sensor histidine kinase/response regulator CckA
VAQSQASARARRSTILIVEDQAMVAAALAALLTEDGHEIMLAEDAEQALELLRARPGLVDLVLCDVVMPVMRGPELVRQIRARGLTAPRVLFMSGYIDIPDLPEGCDLIAKPFAVRELTEAVARTLASQL